MPIRKDTMTRRKIRETVFKILFGLEFNEPAEMDEYAQLELDNNSLFDDDEALEGLDMSDEDKEYIKNRVLDVTAHIEEIDKVIESISKGWRISRIGKAELAILRLAIYEIKYDDDIPVKVAINEAVEISKVYCDEEAKSFVNALLAKIAE